MRWIRNWARVLSIGVVALAGTTNAATAAPAGWPAKTVTVVVPFAAGGATDVVARLLAERLSQVWRQTVVVDNRGGAGGNIGAALVAKAPPDGYTLLMTSGSIVTVNPHLYANLTFDVARDFLPITNVASGPMVVVVPQSPTSPQSLAELVARAKANPRAVSFGSAGFGSQIHMAGESFASLAGVDLTHVPYKGEGPAYADLMGGHIQVMFGNIGAVAGLVRQGNLRALAITGKDRSPMLPDVPTASEAGVAGVDSVGWFGLVAPTGTPTAVVERVWRDTVTALAEPDIRSRLAEQGMRPVGNTPAEFAKAIAAESHKWADVVRNRGLRNGSPARVP